VRVGQGVVYPARIRVICACRLWTGASFGDCCMGAVRPLR
jgi:hypothetical protein